MAIAFVQSADVYGNSVAFSGNVTKGNLVVVIGYGSQSYASVTAAKSAGTATIASLGSTTQNSAYSSNVRIYWFSVTATGSLTMECVGGGDDGISIAEFSGVNLIDAYETVLDTDGSSSSTTADTGDITPAIADSLLVGGYINESQYGLTVTADSSWNTANIVGNQANHQHYAQYDILTSATAQDWTLGFSGNVQSWAIQLVCFNGTAGGASSKSMHHIMNQ